MADPSILFVCLVFFRYPLSGGPVLALALGLALAGGVIQFLLLCKTKKARCLPLLWAGVLAALEILYQLNQFGVVHTLEGHDTIWGYVAFGVMVLYVLLGTAAGWLAGMVFQKSRAGK